MLPYITSDTTIPEGCGAVYELMGVSENCITAMFGNDASEETRRTIVSCSDYLREHPPAHCIAFVPAYASITFHFDRYPNGPGRPLTLAAMKAIVGERLEAWVRSMTSGAPALQREPRIVEIPVRYGGEDGPDLSEVAEYCGMSPAEVVRVHTESLYPVHMLGFMPGFPYLGGLSARLAVPRKALPRTRVPAGSVGLAGRQTGIYPLESPGGWQLIGRTDMVLFDPHWDPPTALLSGDYVRFVEVSR